MRARTKAPLDDNASASLAEFEFRIRSFWIVPTSLCVILLKVIRTLLRKKQLDSIPWPMPWEWLPADSPRTIICR